MFACPPIASINKVSSNSNTERKRRKSVHTEVAATSSFTYIKCCVIIPSLSYFFVVVALNQQKKWMAVCSGVDSLLAITMKRFSIIKFYLSSLEILPSAHKIWINFFSALLRCLPSKQSRRSGRTPSTPIIDIIKSSLIDLNWKKCENIFASIWSSWFCC